MGYGETQILIEGGDSDINFHRNYILSASLPLSS
jgi:hypothetical protein